MHGEMVLHGLKCIDIMHVQYTQNKINENRLDR